jgi:hypothetical protein
MPFSKGAFAQSGLFKPALSELRGLPYASGISAVLSELHEPLDRYLSDKR